MFYGSCFRNRNVNANRIEHTSVAPRERPKSNAVAGGGGLGLPIATTTVHRKRPPSGVPKTGR